MIEEHPCGIGHDAQPCSMDNSKEKTQMRTNYEVWLLVIVAVQIMGLNKFRKQCAGRSDQTNQEPTTIQQENISCGNLL